MITVRVKTTDGSATYTAADDEDLGWQSTNSSGDRVLRIWKNDELIAEYQPDYWLGVVKEYVE